MDSHISVELEPRQRLDKVTEQAISTSKQINDIQFWQAEFETYMQQHASDDAAHDIGHFRRVWRNAQTILRGESADRLVVLTACYFHDFINLAKNHPDRHKASLMSAEQTAAILAKDFPQFPSALLSDVQHAIEAHSFSANIIPRTIEAKIVQDADRLEALGPIGLARVFYIAGRLDSKLFDAEDPLAENRALDDNKYALDHFQLKLLKLPDSMQTKTGKQLADQSADYLRTFMYDLVNELSVKPTPIV
jgi:uncharacterized protein